MSFSPITLEPQRLDEYLHAPVAQSFSYSDAIGLLCQNYNARIGLVIASLPRGGAQIVQPRNVSDSMHKAYAEVDGEDRLTWQAIVQQRPVQDGDIGNNENGTEFGKSPYYQRFLAPAEVHHVIAIPLKGPLFEGYPGALHLYRSAETGRFTEAEAGTLSQQVQLLEQRAERARQGKGQNAANTMPRQFVLDQHLKSILPDGDLRNLDERASQHLLARAKQVLTQPSAHDEAATRMQLPDERGDMQAYRLTLRNDFPAMSDGPVLFVCRQPDLSEWKQLGTHDVEGSPELGRMVPALRFMEHNFAAGPALAEIARTAHLSPFHFHRRFTELFGLTPKQYLLECQIAEAKQQLVARQKELSDIATFCGFAHQSHFTSRFKQATGMTPTRWRRVIADEGGHSQ